MEFFTLVKPHIWYVLDDYYKKYFNDSVVAQTSFGPIKGLKQTSVYGFEYIEFRGVPYAKPPIGNLRFKDPEPLEPWTEPLTTITDSESSQRHMVFKNITGTEDCLRLNIYTKNLMPTKLYPVMVFIHGGSFLFGSNAKHFYNPEYLLQKDVILVVINYRLGSFGFLSIEDPEIQIPGNAGLKDQVLALKWVNENIKYFGGDTQNITLFGESAGACSTHFHMLSDMSRGLFHKVCLMSGTALNIWSIRRINDLPQRLAKRLGWTGDGDIKEIMKILRSASAKSLTKAQDNLITKEERQKFVLMPFGPVIEPYISKQCFIPKVPQLMSRGAWSYNLPLMIGCCSDEGLFMYKTTKKHRDFLDKLNGSFQNIVPEAIESDKTSERCKQISDKIKHTYFGNENISFSLLDNYIQMFGDLWFWHGVHNTINARLSNPNAAETFLYRFDFDSQIQNHSKFIFAERGVPGVCHGDDCSYLFKTSLTVPVKKTSREYKTVEKMVDLWTSFATTGKPISETANCYNWSPLARSCKHKCLNISDELKFIDLPEHDRMVFWDSLYEGVDLY